MNDVDKCCKDLDNEYTRFKVTSLKPPRGDDIDMDDDEANIRTWQSGYGFVNCLVGVTEVSGKEEGYRGAAMFYFRMHANENRQFEEKRGKPKEKELIIFSKNKN